MLDLQVAIINCQTARRIMQKYRGVNPEAIMSKTSLRQTAAELTTLQEEIRILLEDFQTVEGIRNE